MKIHIEAEGDYGFALPHDVEFHVIMGEGGHDDHDATVTTTTPVMTMGPR
ncbi:MAG: hypothetical protein Ct9H90mP16_18220 [Candidatus Poseidoniales archaeon]|nr:MAG: hypothetical protein Ct9H90mP16_18220 [Candidatus Poseidoniales archaeon]